MGLAVVLAAGAGSRMGHRPKGALRVNGRPLIERTLAALRGAGIEDVVVVLGEHRDALWPLLQGLAVPSVFNPQAMSAGLTSSQRLGLQQMRPEHPWVLMALADQPLLAAPDVQALIDAFDQRPQGMQALYPEVKGQPGNPVLLSRCAVEEILRQPPDFGCKDWRQTQRSRVKAWPTDRPCYVTDLDTPQDLDQLRASTGWDCEWPHTGGPEPT
jgi:CTP:molybdopterin cytidylyltransferase MocA